MPGLEQPSRERTVLDNIMRTNANSRVSADLSECVLGIIHQTERYRGTDSGQCTEQRGIQSREFSIPRASTLKLVASLTIPTIFHGPYESILASSRKIKSDNHSSSNPKNEFLFRLLEIIRIYSFFSPFEWQRRYVYTFEGSF